MPKKAKQYEEREEKADNAQLSQDQASRGKKKTRREVLKNIAAAGAVVPLSSLLWQTGGQAQQVPLPALGLDPEKLARTSQIIERVAADPAFRERVKAYPVETLAEMGIILLPETAEGFTMVLKKGNDPDLLIKAMLSAPSPQQMKDLVDVALAPIAPIVIAGITSGIKSTTKATAYVAAGVVAHEVVDPGDPPPPCPLGDSDCP